MQIISIKFHRKITRKRFCRWIPKCGWVFLSDLFNEKKEHEIKNKYIYLRIQTESLIKKEHK